MKIRDVAWNDFHDFVENYYSIYDELPTHPSVGIFLFAEKPSMPAEVRWFGGFYAALLDGSIVASTAEVDGHAVGLCTVHRDGPQEEFGHRGELGILIRKGYRGQGIGKALMRDVLAKCQGRFETVHLGVFSNNEVAKHLYSSLGFVQVGHRPRWIKRGDLYLDEDLMILDLRNFSASSPPGKS